MPKLIRGRGEIQCCRNLNQLEETIHPRGLLKLVWGLSGERCIFLLAGKKELQICFRQAASLMANTQLQAHLGSGILLLVSWLTSLAPGHGNPPPHPPRLDCTLQEAGSIELTKIGRPSDLPATVTRSSMVVIQFARSELFPFCLPRGPFTLTPISQFSWRLAKGQNGNRREGAGSPYPRQQEILVPQEQTHETINKPIK